MTGLGQPLAACRRMTLPEVTRLFEYWRENPPVHEMLAMLARCYTTWQPPQSVEEQQQQGAMSPADFFEHFKRNNGRVEGLSPLVG